MKKRIVALMAVFTMAVGLLGGCGNKNADTNTTSAQSETETDQEAADKVAALIDASMYRSVQTKQMSSVQQQKKHGIN